MATGCVCMARNAAPVWSGAGGLLYCKMGFAFGAGLAGLGLKRGTLAQSAACGERSYRTLLPCGNTGLPKMCIGDVLFS